MSSSDDTSRKKSYHDESGSSRPLLKSKSSLGRTSGLQKALRSLPGLGALFLIIGITVTVFGFVDLDLHPTGRLLLRIVGPACASIALVLWTVGWTVARLRRSELKRRRRAAELRDRVHLHALAIDVLHKPTLSPETLRNPRQRQLLLKQLRQQTAYLDMT